MFGEEVSESPRAPSPWNNLVATPPSSSPHLKAITGGELARIPKLVPEIEEGNVEYKLKLLNPTAARFARLVTQLKWRLLEGGGQAYYELGVADSGMLVGLSRADLEASLETLEMMAGEIGASVIVVKEVEVPRAMVDIAEKLALRERDDATTEDAGWDMMRMGSWESRAKKKIAGGPDPEAASSWSTQGSLHSDGDAIWGSASLATIKPADDHAIPTLRISPPTEQSTVRPSTGSDVDPVFLMDPELESSSSEIDLSSSDLDSDASATQQFDIDLSIASVFKPRPMRRRTHVTNGHQQGSKRGKDKEKPIKSKERRRGGPPAPTSLSEYADTDHLPTKGEAKAQKRRVARDKRREERRKALLGHDGGCDVPDTRGAGVIDPTATANVPAIAVPEPMVQPVANEAPDLAARLDGLHVSQEEAPVVPATDEDDSGAKDLRVGDRDDVVDWRRGGTVGFAQPAPAGNFKLEPLAYGPRLIVEALVVRKMSLEEGFLDFEGFEVV